MNVKESPTEIAVNMDFVLTLDLAEKHPLAAFADYLTEQRLRRQGCPVGGVQWRLAATPI